LGDNVAIHGNHGTTIKIQPIAVAALLVCIEVNPAKLEDKLVGRVDIEVTRYLERRFLYQLNARVQLPQLMMARTRIGEYLDAIESH
jgi:hypothetical protein